MDHTRKIKQTVQLYSYTYTTTLDSRFLDPESPLLIDSFSVAAILTVVQLQITADSEMTQNLLF